MSKISSLAQSIKNTSKNEAENIEQELRNDFEQTRQNINGYLVSVADTIKRDIQAQLSQSAATSVAEAEAATDQASKQIAQQIERLQQRINEQLSEQEAQIVQDMITELKEVHMSIIEQLLRMKKAVSNTDTQLQKMLQDYNSSLIETQERIGKAWDSVESQRWNVEKMTEQLQQAQRQHAETFDKITSTALATDRESGEMFYRISKNIRRTGQDLEQEAQNTAQRTNAQLANINKTIDNISESMTAKLYQRTYHPIAMLVWVLILLLATTIGSCSVYNNHKTSSALSQQINQQRAIIADLNKPINAATASQLANLVMIEQTAQGIKIKSRHPQATETINSRGLTSSLDEKALLIKR